MKILKDYSLFKLNTFGILANAKFFVGVESEKDLAELFNLSEFKQNKKMFLGGGSNVLFTKDFDGIVVLNKLKGVEILENNADTVIIRAMGGEIWHDLVMFAVNNGYWGIENLSSIPGTVGAAPMQNIGAYGAELKDCLESVEAYEIGAGKKKIFNKKECEFGYRDSVFKNELKGKYFISAITLKLDKKEKKNITYKVLADFFERNNIKVKNPKDVSDAVIFIRKSKLPDPKILGNAGSFFKNVFVDKGQLEKLRNKYPDIPHFEENEAIKIPAGWLIEQCGWKGKRIGNVGVHEKQALVLVNYGGATGLEIMELANKIIISVKEKFGLELSPEVNIV
ncbi:MAG: UDP-N-acetylenolpyruvoylglucosamine reductase [Candidatus Nomurabacteria bacterium GW2011_GWB1_40_7]|uniref:UDP-N-acetylenolpyruvoylglucosamine reductase n=1 Tax=Candidatus Nomurabacteria bacterium GW2011_GWB1_40_7 TaxID=1618744 RepID=A0A0G0SYU5_9BACT|nr:MAG: UDP-N-acetylenolpyruvoylglucosamine reductase [Candidatus Nomurabacteria bacterium GW2011_GWB1_40_7]